MLSFNFGGRNSYKDYGILITKRPTIPSSKRRISTVIVSGRNSSLKFDENAYEDITVTIECTLKNKSIADTIDEIKGWLIGAGENDLVFDFQPNKKYKAQIVNNIDFTQGYKIFSKFILVFNCQPFKYEVSSIAINITAADKINNYGTVYSQPIIKVTGVGNIELKIKEQVIKVEGLKDNIILDSIQQNAYSNQGDNLNNKVSGEFPILEVGFNSISWTGTVSNVEIIPNWRWL